MRATRILPVQRNLMLTIISKNLLCNMMECSRQNIDLLQSGKIIQAYKERWG
jgi:hypothetical protein